MTLSQPGSDERRYMRPNNDQTTTAAGRQGGGGQWIAGSQLVLCNLSPFVRSHHEKAHKGQRPESGRGIGRCSGLSFCEGED